MVKYLSHSNIVWIRLMGEILSGSRTCKQVIDSEVPSI